MTTADKPWLESYQIGPFKLERSLAPFPEVPLTHALDRAAQLYPTQTAVLFEGRSLKYHELKSQVDRLAGALARLGLEKGDRVCLYFSNSPEYVLCYWAALKAGGVIVPTSILRTQEGLLHEASESGARFLVCREEHLERAVAVRDGCQIEHLIVASAAGADIEPVASALPKNAHDLRDLLSDRASEPPQIEIDPCQDLCELAFTGGATGVPKGVMLTHFNRHCSMLQGLPWFMKPLLKGLAGKASVVLAVPLFHALGGFIHQSAVGQGIRLILLADPRDTQGMVNCILEHRPFMVPGVPTQFMRLADAGLKRANSMLFSGAAPLPDEVAQAIKHKTGMAVSEGYGLTETAGFVSINLTSFSRFTGFVAKEKPGIGVPCPETEVRLVDPATGQDVVQGDPGELLVRGPQVMKGYWPTPGSGLTADGWLHTGDIAVMDEGGYFRIVDRIKDMVNVSGNKVYTTEVDEVLFKHPAVAMAAAFGVPDPAMPGSERVMAVLQLRPERRGQVSADEIRAFCRASLPPYAVPMYVEFREDMPLTVTEKVFKKTLRDEAIARMKESADA
jgi:long-chain acyl-CoA synthetase